MEENLIEPTFKETKRDSIIKVIGVGGAGCNAVQHMYKEGIVGVDFIVCNTDRQNIESNAVPCKLVIGDSGLGAGANPEKAKNLAEQTEDKIKELIGKNTKMVFITAGMGKGTGTGASPVVARIAHEMGILTIGVVTYPYTLEQKPARLRADAGIAELKKHVDSLIVIKNQKIMEEYSSVKLSVALGLADDVLKNAVKCIAELITMEGYQNVDFSDVESVMKNSGEAMIALAEASGDNRAEEVVRQAMTCPILDDINITDAQNFLFFLRYGVDNEPTMGELNTIQEEFQSYINENTNVIFGHAADKNISDKLSLSVVITNYAKKSEKVVALDEKSNENSNRNNNNTGNSNNNDWFQAQVAEQPTRVIDITDLNTIAPNITPDFTQPEQNIQRPQNVQTNQPTNFQINNNQPTGVHMINDGTNQIYDNDDSFRKHVDTPAYVRTEQSVATSTRLMDIQSNTRKFPQPSYNTASEIAIFGNFMAD